METAAGLDTGQTVGAVLQSAATLLSQAGIVTGRLDAEVLLACACDMERVALYVRWHDDVPEPAAARFAAMLNRRRQREPLQYIVGRQEFWSLDFMVTPDVLIPRPETELLVELALSKLPEPPAFTGMRASTSSARAVVSSVSKENSASAHPERVEGCPGADRTAGSQRRLRICDLGTGSGCLAVTLAHELPHADVCALDISPRALSVARMNACRHGVEERVQFILSDGFSALRGCGFDAIVCNPPYVRSEEIANAQPELLSEPRQALDGGEDGLAVIQRILAEAPACLNDGGWLLMEIGAEQGREVERLARAAHFSAAAVLPDYAGLPRVLTARR